LTVDFVTVRTSYFGGRMGNACSCWKVYLKISLMVQRRVETPR